MREPIIQADQNLLLNGDFSEDFKHWNKGPVCPGSAAVMTDYHGAEYINYLRAARGSSVFQSFLAPKSISPHVRYCLSFLYESMHTRAGTLRVTVVETGLQQDIDIPAPPAQAIEQKQHLLAQGQPFDLNLTPSTSTLNLELTAGQTLRVEVISPENDAGDLVSEIRVARIELLLHLDLPLQLQALQLDEESLSPGAPLHFCLGADFDSHSGGHHLRFIPQDDSDWLGTQASLTIENNPQGAILAQPGWEIDQPLQQDWQLSCPLIGDDEPYLFSLQLRNQYTALPYPLEVSLGHHRLAFRERLEAAYYPVLECEQSVRLGVQVISWYTSQPLAGRTVNWAVDGQGLKAASNTDDNGWAYFDYKPTSEGDFTIMASAYSPYYQAGTVSETFAVKALATDPWKAVLAVSDGVETPWSEKTGYPNRGADYPLRIKVPAALQGTSLSLAWSGDSPEQLGVTISPPLGERVPVGAADPLWTLTNADRFDGLFSVQLSCSKLKLPSPFKKMSLARNVVKIGEVREANKFPIIDEEESVLLRLQVLHDVALGDGDPVVSALVEWVLPDGGTHQASTGSGGWASLLYTPTAVGDMEVVAKVKAHADAVPVERPFQVKALATSPWRDQVVMWLDDVVVDRKVQGVLCRRGQTHTLKVAAVPGSEWVDKEIALHWRDDDPDIGLRISDLGARRPLTEGGLTWTLSSGAADSLSRLFELKLTTDGIPERELFGRLISQDLSEELFLVLDQMTVSKAQQLFPCLGAVHHYNLRVPGLSPLVGLEALIGWAGTNPEDLGGVIAPDRLCNQIISDSGVTWTFDFSGSQHPGEFTVGFGIYGFQPFGFNDMTLGHHRLKIESSRESAVDPVVGLAPAWLWTRVISHYTQAPVEGVPVRWNSTQSSNTDAHGWSGFAFAPQEAGAHTISAAVDSPYNGYEERRSMNIMALASDPWESLSVRFDGGTAYPWGHKTAFPRRKGQHRIELLAPNDNPLIGRQLTLGMTGTGPAELDIRFESGQALGTPVTFQGVGLAFAFAVGDVRDGSFNLQLAAERLASLSPANAMSLGPGTQVLKFAEGARIRQVLDWNQELLEQVTLVSSISGRPMVGIEVTWTHTDLGTQTSLTDFYGVARIRFTPRTPGASVLRARVGDEVYSDSVGLDFTLNEPRKIGTLTALEPSGYPGQKMSAQATVVSAISGQPLPDTEVMWEFDGIRLDSTLTDINGNATVEFILSVPGERLLTAIVKGGLAGWYASSIPVLVLEDEVLLESLITDKTTLYQGESVSAIAKVVYSRNGHAAKGLQVSWDFPQLSFLPSETDERGQARVEFKPGQFGNFDLIARVERSEVFKQQVIAVLDPLSSPEHGRIKQVIVEQSPIGPADFANIKAVVVHTVTGLPMAGRDVQVTTNFMGVVTFKTNHEGQVEVIWRPMQAGPLHLVFTVINPGGTISTDSASVEVT
ncbi:hypothetical protein [Pseudomonas sp. WC2]|uniref:hypothetical protein n=1 Tax=Pseudomonas sp. WC2 TaxID=3424773 RepID=UPI003D3296A3